MFCFLCRPHRHVCHTSLFYMWIIIVSYTFHPVQYHTTFVLFLFLIYFDTKPLLLIFQIVYLKLTLLIFLWKQSITLKARYGLTCVKSTIESWPTNLSVHPSDWSSGTSALSRNISLIICKKKTLELVFTYSVYTYFCLYSSFLSLEKACWHGWDAIKGLTSLSFEISGWKN